MPGKVIYSSEPEDFYYMNLNVPCQAACPALTNIPAYIRALYEENYDRSYEINCAANILPGVLGRICSRPCEDKCRHGESELGKPVNICHIKRAASDMRDHEWSPKKLSFPSTGKNVAIIGSGPAGIAAAQDLSTIGFSVSIFEAKDEPGGMLRYGIPEFRLPRDILDSEIGYALRKGVELKAGVRVGADIGIEELTNNFDAVLLAAGCYESIPLGIPGEEMSGVFSGLEFMMDVCSGRSPALGKNVLVIGAGFTAFDCARSALRLGSENVSICLRRTEEDLTVTRDEILETKKEGIKIEPLLISRRIMGNGTVQAVEFVRSNPGRIRSDGKREVAPIEGSEFSLSVDSVIVATGQRQAPIPYPQQENAKDILKGDRDTNRSSLDNVYVAGDYLTGPSTVIEAVAMGRKAAERIAEDLTGDIFREKVVRQEDTQTTDRNRPWDYIARQEMPTLSSVEGRLNAIDIEVETGFKSEQAKEESKRCYLCYLHYEIDISRCIYCRYCIDVAPRDCIKMVDELITNDDGAITGFKETDLWENVNAIVIDNSRCIRCGECMRVCPVDCISVTKVELRERFRGNNND